MMYEQEILPRGVFIVYLRDELLEPEMGEMEVTGVRVWRSREKLGEWDLASL